MGRANLCCLAVPVVLTSAGLRPTGGGCSLVTGTVTAWELGSLVQSEANVSLTHSSDLEMAQLGERCGPVADGCAVMVCSRDMTWIFFPGWLRMRL